MNALFFSDLFGCVFLRRELGAVVGGGHAGVVAEGEVEVIGVVEAALAGNSRHWFGGFGE